MVSEEVWSRGLLCACGTPVASVQLCTLSTAARQCPGSVCAPGVYVGLPSGPASSPFGDENVSDTPPNVEGTVIHEEREEKLKDMVSAPPSHDPLPARLSFEDLIGMSQTVVSDIHLSCLSNRRSRDALDSE